MIAVEDVEVPRLAEAIAVPGGLGAEGGPPGGVEDQAEGAEVRARAPDGHPALVDALVLGLTPLGAVERFERGLRPERAGAHPDAERVDRADAARVVDQLVAHVVQEEGAGRHREHPVEDHAGGRLGEVLGRAGGELVAGVRRPERVRCRRGWPASGSRFGRHPKSLPEQPTGARFPLSPCRRPWGDREARRGPSLPWANARGDHRRRGPRVAGARRPGAGAGRGGGGGAGRGGERCGPDAGARPLSGAGRLAPGHPRDGVRR